MHGFKLTEKEASESWSDMIIYNQSWPQNDHSSPEQLLNVYLSDLATSEHKQPCQLHLYFSHMKELIRSHTMSKLAGPVPPKKVSVWDLEKLSWGLVIRVL